MNSLTIRAMPKKIEEIIRNRAAQSHTSLNKTVICLLEEVTGIKKAKKVQYHDLDSLCGTWSKQEAKEFDRTLEQQRTIDRDLWK